MATDAGDHKRSECYEIGNHDESAQCMNDLEGRVVGRSRTFPKTLEHGDRQGVKVRPRKKRNTNKNKVTIKRLHGDIAKVGSEVVSRKLTCREALGNMFLLQSPVWHCTLVEGQGSAALNISVQKDQVQWENLAFHIRNDTWNHTSLSCRLFRSVPHATPLKAMSPNGETLNAYFEYSDIPLRLSNTYSAKETKTCPSCGSVYRVRFHETTPDEGNTVLNPTILDCCLQIIQHSKAQLSDSPGDIQLEIKTEATTNASVENPHCHEHKKGEHHSNDYNLSNCYHKRLQIRGIYMVYVNKLKRGCSIENGQLDTFSKTLNTTHNVWALKVFSCCSNAGNETASTCRSGHSINAASKQNDNTRDKGNNINNENIESCVSTNSNESIQNLSGGCDDNNNKNNNSNDHHLDSDGSSDSEIDCLCDEDKNSCKSAGHSLKISNGVPPTRYQTDAENLQDEYIDSVNTYFKEISLESSRNATQRQVEQRKETTTGISLTLANDGKLCKTTIYNSISKLGVPQPTECTGEKLVDDNCESGHTFFIYNPSEVFLYSGQTDVLTRTELETQNNPEAENYQRVDISKDIEVRRVNSSTNQALQTENNLNHGNPLSPEDKRGSDSTGECEDSTTRNDLCLSQILDDDVKMSAGVAENLSPSQEDFTENNRTLQAHCLNKTGDFEGMANTEITEPVRILRGFYDEPEILKYWQGSVYVRQTGQCCLEDIKCVNFLGMLTNRLTEHTRNDAVLPNLECSAPSADESELSQQGNVSSDKALISGASRNSDKKTISFCEITDRGIDTPPAYAAMCDKQRGYANTPTTEISTEAVVDYELFPHPKTGSVNKAHLSSKQTRSSRAPDKNVFNASIRNSRQGSTQDVRIETSANSQQAEDRNSCEIWSTKYTMSLSDRFLKKYDLLTMQSKEKYKKSKTGATDLKRNTNFDFAAPVFEVDVFRSLEYATSLSCGLPSEKRSTRPVDYEQSNFSGGFHDLSAIHPKESSCKNDRCIHDRETVPLEPPECQKMFPVSTSDENNLRSSSEEEAAIYNRERIIKASERRRKLMTEFEEITSCIDVYGWPRYDNRNFCYESGHFYHDFDKPLKRQVTNLDSAVPSVGTRIIGTLTIEYLNPPVSGFVLLK